MKYSLKFTNEAREDIRGARIYYRNQQKDLGRRFHETVKEQSKTLHLVAHFAIRYNNIRCLPLMGFPFMLHYFVNAETRTVWVLAVIHTSQNPDKHWLLHQ